MSNVALTAPGSQHSYAARVGRLLWHSFLVQWPFYLVAAVYVLTTYLMVQSLPAYKVASFKSLAMGLILFSILPGIVAIFLLRIVQYAFVLKPAQPLRQLLRDAAIIFRDPSYIIVALPMLLAMMLFNKGMLELKPMIPLIKPFAFDTQLMELDRLLHFGVDPWRLLQPLVGYDIITLLLSICYNFWFLALFGTFLWFGFSRQTSAVRTQFFLSYMLCWWIGGGLLAVFFSSAGPVYYGTIGLSPDPYAPLFDYLKDVDTRMPIWTLDAQQLLWDGYIGKAQPLGISAFPSMHNASAVVFALATRKVSRIAGRLFAAYALIILVGSVHLGWHYAVDSYAAIIMALIVWWLCGHIARWHARLPSTRRFNENLAAL